MGINTNNPFSFGTSSQSKPGSVLLSAFKTVMLTQQKQTNPKSLSEKAKDMQYCEQIIPDFNTGCKL